MFGLYFFGLMAVYFCYYMGMIGYDLYIAEKMENPSESAKVVDVSAAASSYVPKDVRSMMDGTSQSQKKNEDADETGGGAGGRSEFLTNQYPEGFSVNSLKDMFVQQAQTPDMFDGFQLSF